MMSSLNGDQQIRYVKSFNDLVHSPFQGIVNAICWKRNLSGDFAEIVTKIQSGEKITEITEEQLSALDLSKDGQDARAIILQDLIALKTHGAKPLLNLINCYARDEDNAILSTDVYSFHVDRSPIATDTFLCTYYGASSEILPNELAEQKILDPEIRHQLMKRYNIAEVDFEDFAKEHFFDLHYRAKPYAALKQLGTGNLWRLAVDYPGSKVPPCVHRAPFEQNQKRLLLIC